MLAAIAPLRLFANIILIHWIQLDGFIRLKLWIRMPLIDRRKHIHAHRLRVEVSRQGLKVVSCYRWLN